MRSTLAFALLCQPLPSKGEADSRRPFVRMYHQKSIGVDSRIFSVAEGQDGILFAAAPDSNSIAIFNGTSWSVLPVNSACISLACSPQGTVWVCLDDEIGYLKKNELGNFSYVQFDPGLPPEQTYFFDCQATDSGVRFASTRMILDVDESTNPPSESLLTPDKGEKFLAWNSPVVFAQNLQDHKIYQLSNGRRELLNEDFSGRGINYVFKLNNEFLYIRDGWTRLQLRQNGRWKNFSEELAQLSAGIKLQWTLPMSGNRIGCATSIGFFCLNENGEINYRISKRDGIETDRLISWGELSDKRVWIASAAGIAILTQSSARYEQTIFSLPTTPVYDLQFHDGKIYIVSGTGSRIISSETNKNLDRQPESELIAQPTSISQLFKDGGELYAAGYDGVVCLSNDAPPVFNQTVSRIVRVSDDRVVVRSFGSNFSVLDTGQKEWNETLRFDLPSAQPHLYVQDKTVWFSGLNGKLKAMDFSSGWDNKPKPIEISSETDFDRAFVYGEIDDEFVVVTDAGILVSKLVEGIPQLRSSSKFEPLVDVFAGNARCGIVDCGATGLVILKQNIATLHPQVDGQYQKDPIRTWELASRSCQKAIWDEQSDLLKYVENGRLVSLDIENVDAPQIRNPVLSASSLDLVADQNIQRLLSPGGSISFNFGLPTFGYDESNVEFRSRLVGLEEKWTRWSNASRRDFTNLPGGNYSFAVMARTGTGLVSESEMDFNVGFPWYQSLWFATIALFGLTALVIGVSQLRNRQLRDSNRRMELLVAQRTREIEQKKSEIQRKAAQLDQLDRQNEADRLTGFETLVAGISHDFNNLLMVISSSNELIQNLGDPQSRQFATDSQKAVESATELCNELTDYSGSIPIELVATSMQSFVKGSRELIENSMPPGVAVDFLFETCEQPTSFLADSRQLRRALLNLVINAAEVARSKVIIGTRYCEVSEAELKSARYIGEVPQPGGYVCLRVSDDGRGIEKDLLNSLFDPFVTSKKLGRGLGLTIVMKIVGRHGGVVFVDSEVGVGSEFRVCFPAVHVEGINLSTGSTSRLVKQARIMLVDDDEQVLASTTKILESSGHSVVGFQSPTDALHSLTEMGKNDFDCLILDISMPEMSGVEMAEVVLEWYPGTPIIFISGYSGKIDVSTALRKHSIDFLLKPFTRRSINESINKALC